MDSCDISIVVPTRNEANNLPFFLASIPDSIQLIIVDSSQDSTPALARRLRPINTHIVERMCNIAQARQIGAEVARTPWLLFTDADITFAPNYFERLQTVPPCDVVYGSKQSQTGFTNYYRWFTRAQGWSQALGIPAASGSNLLIRRPVLKAVGGFDQQLVCNEDSEIVWRIRRYGYRVRFDPGLIVYERDHRRLERGALAKTLHSGIRCALLYFNLMPSRWRSRDWGYWSVGRRRSREDNQKGSSSVCN
ncbi:MAG: glycosyltransferase [Anaerolineae bacterium]|nr:glycosyltransferase [Thermoflexales bacterium]MDW8408153.1 glycosyltransferase [Anaerolineae bacterium]